MRKLLETAKIFWDACGIIGDIACDWLRRLRTLISQHKAATGLVLVFAWLYTRSLGDHPLFDSIEGLNAAVSLSMGTTSHLMTPAFGLTNCAGRTFGSWWLGAIGLKIFGHHELALRIWSCLGMLGTACLCASYSRRTSTSRSTAAICTSMTVAFIVSQLAASQGMFAFFTALAMFGMAPSNERHEVSLWAHCACIAAVLVRGLEGALLPWLSVSLYCLIKSARHAAQSRGSPTDVADGPAPPVTEWWQNMKYACLTLAAMLLWIAALAIWGDGASSFLFYQSLDSLYPQASFSLGVLVAVLVAFTPWTGFVIQSSVSALRDSRNYDEGLYLVVWLVTFLIGALLCGDLLLLSGAVPPAAVLAARLPDDRTAEAVSLNILVHVPLLLVLLVYLIWTFPAALTAFVPWAALVLLTLYSSWFYTKTRQSVKFRRNTCAAALLCLLPLAGMFNLVAERESPRDKVMDLRHVLNNDDAIVLVGENRPSVFFYTGHEYFFARRVDMSLMNGTAGIPGGNFGYGGDSSDSGYGGLRGVDTTRMTLSNQALQSLWGGRNRVFMILRVDGEFQVANSK